MIAKLDGDSNEAKGLQITKFPTLIYFPKDKTGQVISYSGNLSIDYFTQFLYA